MRFHLRLYPRGQISKIYSLSGGTPDQTSVSLFLCYKPVNNKPESEVCVGFICSIMDSSGAKHERKGKKLGVILHTIGFDHHG